ncbi:MAG: hypothetical protein COB59_00135 [Rhodospirillaceae bacterium]|nr:MAG: hypothetical protein COB59_00135 [Rhodospirillaceae bacterium]
MSDDEFINEASSLDEQTHTELRMMHQEGAEALLFAKKLQWQSVGSSLLVFGASIAISMSNLADKSLIDLLVVMIIVLTCGVILVLVLYQFWQFNEITRIKKIDGHFSSLYKSIKDVKSSREGNYHRYTLLVAMVLTVIMGAAVAIVSIQKSLMALPN